MFQSIDFSKILSIELFQNITDHIIVANVELVMLAKNKLYKFSHFLIDNILNNYRKIFFQV